MMDSWYIICICPYVLSTRAEKWTEIFKISVCASAQYILSLEEHLPFPSDDTTARQDDFERRAATRTKGFTSFFFNIQSLSFRDFRFPLRSRFFSCSLLLSNGTCSSSVSRPFGNCCCCPPPPPPTNKHKNTFLAFLEFGKSTTIPPPKPAFCAMEVMSCI